MVQTITQQCPFAGGTAVYRARGMYELINDSIVYDDDAVCLAQGLYRSSNHDPVELVNTFL